MQADKFTIKSQEAVQAAQALAHERGNPEITPEHLLAVLLEQDGGIVVPLLAKLGVAPADVRAARHGGARQAAVRGGRGGRSVRAHRESWCASSRQRNVRRPRCRTSSSPPSTC